ncbi:MAG: hypothetical protein KDD73_15655 [Anaerolineales bacterium]|nr:hypothetical protein [Anaerolineales bacterium]MCB9127385.1 hypothetical protein [Ardenticatenales bacterium]MCB9172717.1 hypothetical protein [Ardenticatenales bacterium]
MVIRDRLPAITLFILWLIASGLMLGGHLLRQPELGGLGTLAGLLFIVGLILFLLRSPPQSSALPEIAPLLPLRRGYGATVALILAVLILLFVVGLAVHPWLVLVIALTLMAVGLIVAYRSHVTPALVMVGLLAGGLCFALAWFSGQLDLFQGMYLACIPILFIGGGILTELTGLTPPHAVAGRWRLALKGFGWGALLALPAALLNVSSGAEPTDLWVDQRWEPMVALLPAIAEEIWARLFMTTLLYALLRPTVNQRPNLALISALFIAALAHGLAHLPSVMIVSPAAAQMVIAALLFGVPMGLLFVKRDFDHAVGYHFLVDFVRFWVAL